jgi:hypothetical protein
MSRLAIILFDIYFLCAVECCALKWSEGVTPSHDPRVYFKKKNPIPPAEETFLLHLLSFQKGVLDVAFLYKKVLKNFLKKFPTKNQHKRKSYVVRKPLCFNGYSARPTYTNMTQILCWSRKLLFDKAFLDKPT